MFLLTQVPVERGLPRQSKSMDSPDANFAPRRSLAEGRALTQQCDRIFKSEGTSFTQLNQYLLKDEIGKVCHSFHMLM